MFRKRQNVEFQSLENAKIKIAKFGKGKILDSCVWKKQKFRFAMFGKDKFKIPVFGKSPNLEYQCLEKVKI